MASVTEPTAKPRATSNESSIGEHRFLIHNVSWESYEALLELFGDEGPKMNYCRGELELMSPLIAHERPRNLFGYMIETIVVELNIPADALGSITYKQRLAESGLEPDECYYLANAGKLVSKLRPDLDIEPPPDLAIEIEITNSLVDKLSIYAGIGVPEIWRFNGSTLTILILQPDRTYVISEGSSAFPFLPMGEVLRFIKEYNKDDETGWRRSFQLWVREVLLPGYRRVDLGQ
jgi:Uma2 family endonuclease